MRAILGSGGKVRGYIRECGDRKELLAPGGQLLGYFDGEKTLRAGGSFYSYGDCLMELLED
jgi:hypothetical protein